jgi:hypothetical protein
MPYEGTQDIVVEARSCNPFRIQAKQCSRIDWVQWQPMDMSFSSIPKMACSVLCLAILIFEKVKRINRFEYGFGKGSHNNSIYRPGEEVIVTDVTPHSAAASVRNPRQQL